MEKFFLREITENDILLLFKWANDSEVRRNSFSTAVISLEEHTDWFKKAILDHCTLIYILTDGWADIGMIRFSCDFDAQTAVASYSISKGFRGQGHGGRIIQLAEKVVFAENPEIKTIKGFVKSCNDASRRIFINNGYNESYDPEKDQFVYVKRIN